jgi:group I intron endonuclease
MLIYKITNRVNGKVYIGKTNTTIAKRWRKHLNEAKWHDLRHLYAAINKYGKENFTIETIEICDGSEGGEREKYWIKHYNSTNQSVGYNLTEGGENGIRSEEYKRRISNTLKKYYQTHPPPPNPTKGKFGVAHHFYGKTHTPKTKQSLSDARKGKCYEDVMSKETAARLKSMHKESWVGNKNPAFKELPVQDIINTLHTFPLLTAGDIANQYQVSYPTVLDKFKRHTGMTFEQYKKTNLGFNHGVYKRLKNMGVDKTAWMRYSSEEQYRLGCKL